MLALLFAGPTKAADDAPAADGDFRAEEIEADAPAPFAGVVYTSDLAAKLQAAAESADERVAEEKRRGDEDVAREKLSGDRRVKAHIDAAVRLTAMFERELARATPWYESPAFVAPLTVALTLGVVLIVGYSIREISVVYTPTGATP